MGIFSSFKSFLENQKSKKIQRNLRLVKNAKAIKEDRVAALEFFKNHPDPEVSVPALLERFEYSLEHGINDTREKELAMAGIVAHGAKVVVTVRHHLAKTSKIAWPIKILEAVGTEEDLVESLKNALNFSEVSFVLHANEKNYDLLCHLAGFQIPTFLDKIAHFLVDPDERIRFAAVEVFLAQNNPEVQRYLEPLLGDETPENRRLRAAVGQAFAEKKWKVNSSKWVTGMQIAERYVLAKSGFVERL